MVGTPEELYEVLLHTLLTEDGVRGSLRDALARYVPDGGDLLDADCAEVRAQRFFGDESYQHVLREVVDNLFGDVVIKKVKSVSETEYGFWIDPCGETRLRRDYDVARWLNMRERDAEYCRSNALIDFGDPLLRYVESISFESDVYLQKRMEGVSLLACEDRGEALALKLAAGVAILHGDLSSTRVVVDFKKEFNYVCGLLGFDLDFPFEFVYNGVVHNSLHPGQVLVDGRHLTVLDYELVAKGMRQDDLIRLFRGPVKFDVDLDLVLKFYFVFKDFVGVQQCIGVDIFDGLVIPTQKRMKGLENDSDFRRFMFDYHLRRVPMHMWAFDHLQRKGVKNDQLEQVVDATLEAERYGGWWDRRKIKRFRRDFEKQVGKVI